MWLEDPPFIESIDDFPFTSSFYEGIPIAMFHYRRVYYRYIYMYIYIYMYVYVATFFFFKHPNFP